MAGELERAMVLAAGLGTRMRPITDKIPKPLVSVNGKALLDHALDALQEGGVHRATINVHYLADQIETHVASRQSPTIEISDEREQLLDSGGGVKKAAAQFSPGPFFILNADSFWVDGSSSTIAAMKTAWNGDEMDILLLVATAEQAVGFDGKGDFFMGADNRLTRRGTAEKAPAIYAGAIIAKAELFHAISDAKFSLNRMFDEAITNQRLFGCPLDGLWLHVGTPASVGEAEEAIKNHAAHGLK